ncbi:HEPN domain-containing protein [Promicromonospora soli]
MLRWEQGRDKIETLLRDRHIERVSPSREQANFLLDQARRHIATAGAQAEADPALAYSALYDAARKSLVAILANEGLRPTSAGGHIATYDAVAAQLVPPLGSQLSGFHRMRRMRNSNEYPNFDEPNAEAQDVFDDLPEAEAIIAIANRVLDQMPVY